MPKTSPEIARLKAAKVVKSLQKNGMSVADTARELNVSRQAIQKQISHNPYVRDALACYLQAIESVGLDDMRSARVIAEAMNAKKVLSVPYQGQSEESPKMATLIVPDHKIRLKANDQYLRIKFFLWEQEKDHAPVYATAKDSALMSSIQNQIAAIDKRKNIELQRKKGD